MFGLDMIDRSLLVRRDTSPIAIAVVSMIVVALVVLNKTPDASIFKSLLLISISAISLWGWHRANRIWHFIADTPLSKIDTAAQGYVELQGVCDLHGRDSQGFASGPPCIWQRFVVRGRDGSVTDTGVSSAPFVLDDGTGNCVVYPEGATVMSSSRRSWREGGNQYTVRYIRPGATLYVLGALRTTGGSNTERNQGVELSAMLRTWKQDPEFMRTEFDANGDGEIDAGEWDDARARATVVLQRLNAERSIEPVSHVLAKPQDGSPFLISDKDPEPLGRVFQALSLLNLTLAFLTLYLAVNAWR
jgi:hypothetical protein